MPRWLAGKNRAALVAVRQLHTATSIEVITGDCLNGDCDHYLDRVECPLVRTMVCGHCEDLASGGTTGDDADRFVQAWPCPTILAAAGRPISGLPRGWKVEALARRCKICGCTDERACLGGCAWVPGYPDLCTACAPSISLERVPTGTVDRILRHL